MSNSYDASSSRRQPIGMKSTPTGRRARLARRKARSAAGKFTYTNNNNDATSLSNHEFHRIQQDKMRSGSEINTKRPYQKTPPLSDEYFVRKPLQLDDVPDMKPINEKDFQEALNDPQDEDGVRLRELRQMKESEAIKHSKYYQMVEKAFRNVDEIPAKEEALKKYSKYLNSQLDFVSDPWDDNDERLRKAFTVRKQKSLFHMPYEFRQILSDKNPAEKKADAILEASNSGLLTAEEVDKMFKDLQNENSRMKRQFRQQLSPSHFTDAVSLQTLELSHDEKEEITRLNDEEILQKQRFTKLMEKLRSNDQHNLLKRIEWPLASELNRLENWEKEGMPTIYQYYTRKHRNLSEDVKEKLKQIDLDPVMTEQQRHLRARDLIAEYQFDIFEDPHAEYRREYMSYINFRQRLMRDRLGLPLTGRGGVAFQYNVAKSDELHDFAKSRGQGRAIPSPRFLAKVGTAGISEVLRVWEMDNLDNNMLNKRLYGHFTRQFRTHLHRRRMNRRWLRKMIPKTYRAAQIYKHYFKKAIRRMK